MDGNDQVEFDEEGIHKVTGTKYDEEGYDYEGLDNDKHDKNGRDRSKTRG